MTLSEKSYHKSIYTLSQFAFEEIQRTNDLSFLIIKDKHSIETLSEALEEIIEEYIKVFNPERHIRLIELKKDYAIALCDLLSDDVFENKLQVEIKKNDLLEYSKIETESKDPTSYLFKKYGQIDKKSITVFDYNQLINNLNN